MTSLIGAKRRAEEFAAALEGDAAWSEVHPELADLADLVAGLRAHDPVEPSPEFSATLRTRLLAEAEQLHSQDALLTLPERRRGRRERRFAIAASALVFVGGTAGMAAAAQQALPGDALYPIKRGLEQAQAGLATNDGSKGRDLLGQADNRLAEIQKIVDGSSSTSQLPPTIDAFRTQATAGSRLLMQSYAQTNNPQAIKDVRHFTTHNLSVLQDVAGTAPAAQQEELTQAAMALLGIDAKAVKTCPDCAPNLPALQMPKLFSATADVTRALGRVAKQPGISNEHPALPDNQLPAPPASQQPSTGDSTGTGTGSGDAQPSLPGLPTGSGGGTGGGDNTGGATTDQHPLRDLVKHVTGDGSGSTTKDDQDPGGLVGTLLP